VKDIRAPEFLVAPSRIYLLDNSIVQESKAVQQGNVDAPFLPPSG
jgi:hypothetical protein